MKKVLLSILVCISAFFQCNTINVFASDCIHADGSDTDHWCDTCEHYMEELCTDTDGNHFCDECEGHAFRFCTESDTSVWDGVRWARVEHQMFCNVCRWSHWEYHIDEDSNSYCDVCSAYMACSHDASTFIKSYQEAGHQLWCSECQQVVEQDPHVLVYVSDENGHQFHCEDSNCDYQFNKVPHTYDDGDWTSRSQVGHYLACDDCESEIWQDHSSFVTCDICDIDVTEVCNVYVGDKGLTDGQYIDTEGNISTTRPDGGYAYYKDGVLELNNYVYEGIGNLWKETSYSYLYYAAISTFVPLKLKVTGNNTLTILEEEDIIVGGIAAALGSLTIDGSGNLEIVTAGIGISAYCDLTIENGKIAIVADGYGLFMSESEVDVKGGTINVTSQYDNGIVLSDSSMTVSGGEISVTSAVDGILIAASELVISGGIVRINAEHYGIYGYADGGVEIYGGYLDIQTSKGAIAEVPNLNIAEDMLPKGCKVETAQDQNNYYSYIVDQNGEVLTSITLVAPTITEVIVTVDGVSYSEGKIVITPETESIVFTISVTNFSKHSEEHLIMFANGVTISTTDTGFIFDETNGTATCTVPIDLITDLEGFVGFEISYSNEGNSQETLIGTGIFLTYCVEHTPDERGQTCKGYFCTFCESWYGEINELNHAENHNGFEISADGTKHTATYPCCGEVVIEEHSTEHENDKSATCMDKAYCSICDSEYGDVDSTAHTYEATWVTDNDNHWKECECGEKSEIGAHVDNNGDDKCDTCDYTMPAKNHNVLYIIIIIGVVAVGVIVCGAVFVIRKRRK